MKIKLKRGSKLQLGTNLVSDGYGNIIVDEHGEVYIGDRVYFNDAFMISCKEKVTIGEELDLVLTLKYLIMIINLMEKWSQCRT